MESVFDRNSPWEQRIFRPWVASHHSNPWRHYASIVTHCECDGSDGHSCRVSKRHVFSLFTRFHALLCVILESLWHPKTDIRAGGCFSTGHRSSYTTIMSELQNRVAGGHKVHHDQLYSCSLLIVDTRIVAAMHNPNVSAEATKHSCQVVEKIQGHGAISDEYSTEPSCRDTGGKDESRVIGGYKATRHSRCCHEQHQ